MEKILLGNIQFTIKKSSINVRTNGTFKEIMCIKKMRKEDMKRILKEKMGVEFNG